MITFRKITVFLFGLLFVSSVIFPLTPVNKVAFALVLVIAFIRYLNQPDQCSIHTAAPVVLFLIFLYGFVLSFLNDSDGELALQFFLSILVLFLIYPVKWYKINLDGIVKVAGFSMALVTLLFYIVLLTPELGGVGEVAVEISTKYSSASNAKRDFGGGDAQDVYLLGSVGFLFLPFSIYFMEFLKERRLSQFLGMLTMFISIAVGMARGPLTVCVIFAVIAALARLKPMKKVVLILVLIPMGATVGGYVKSNTMLFSSQEASNEIKIGHLESFFDNLSPRRVVLGEGLGANYFSKGRGFRIPHTELTPFDMLRYFGFVLAPLLFLIMIFPTRNLGTYFRGDNPLHLVFFLLYIVVSTTNPYLFNSYGLLVVLWYWSKIFLSEVQSDTPNASFELGLQS